MVTKCVGSCCAYPLLCIHPPKKSTDSDNRLHSLRASESLPSKDFADLIDRENLNLQQGNLDSTVAEFRKSAIPDWYAEIAIERWGQAFLTEALTEFSLTGRNGSSQRIEYRTKDDARRIQFWEQYTEAGGWAAQQATLSGIEPVAYVKLNTPRTDRDGDIIKYETPGKAEAIPLLAPHTWGMGFNVLQHCPKRVQDAYRKRFKANSAAIGSLDEGWWDFVEAHPEIPIVVGEGWKKGLSVAVRSYPALSLRGVTCFFKKRLNQYDVCIPHTAVDRLCCKGRRIVIAFDKDEKEKTRKNVDAAIARIAKWLEKRGCKVSIADWDKELGKGIDDVLYQIQSQQGEDAAQAWLDGAIASATSYRVWKRDRWVTEALGKLDRLNSLTFPIERETSGEYLPQLPTLSPGAIHVVSATMNSGKTVRIGADWVKNAIAAGGRILALSPLNSLGQQSANDWNLPHIHDFALDKESQNALWSDVSHRGGVVMCPDSLHRLPAWFWQRDGRPCPVWLVLDEANQVVSHLLSGQTLGHRWSDIVGRFAAAARHAIEHGAIVLSEDGIPDRAVEFVRSISNPDAPVRVFKHTKISTPWDVTVYEGQASGFRRKLLEAIAPGRHLIATSSQAEARRLERAIGRKFPDKKVSRIDSETNESGAYRDFFTHPDRWLQAEQPDVVIVSPSVKSGVSIEGSIAMENAYFDRVWGYFSCLELDTHWQLLGRYRPPVPRHIYCPRFIQQSGDEGLMNARSIARRLALNSKAMERVYELDAGDGERTAWELEIEAAALQFISQSLAASGLQKSIAQDALLDRLEVAGHFVSIEAAHLDRETSQRWQEIQEELWREDAAFAAALEIDPEKHDREWAIEQLNSMEASKASRTRAQKVLWRDAFPGVGFDDPEDCYQAIYRDYGRMKRGVQMQAMTEMPECVKESERAAVEAILQGNLRAIHRLPKNYARALLLSKLGVLELLDGTPYSDSDPRAIAIKRRALDFSKIISNLYGGRLNICDRQTPVEICNKLLRKFGFEIDKPDRPGAISVERPGPRGENRDRIYRVNPDFDPLRTRLLEAARRKLSESVSAICNSQSNSLQIADTKTQIAKVRTLAPHLEEARAMLDEFAGGESASAHLSVREDGEGERCGDAERASLIFPVSPGLLCRVRVVDFKKVKKVEGSSDGSAIHPRFCQQLC